MTHLCNSCQHQRHVTRPFRDESPREFCHEQLCYIQEPPKACIYFTIRRDVEVRNALDAALRAYATQAPEL